MIIHNINNEKINKKVGFKINDTFNGKYNTYDKNEDGTVSCYIMEIHNKKRWISEAIIFGHNEVIAVNKKYSMSDLYHWLSKSKNFGNNFNLVKKIYGDFLYTGFNQRTNVNIKTIHPIVSNKLHLDVIKTVDMNLCSYNELDSNAVKEIARLNYILNVAYIQRISDDATVIRIFAGKSGEVVEHSRILTIGEVTKFLYLVNGNYIEDMEPSIDAFDFAIGGMDDLDGTHVGYIYNGDSVNLCLSLMSKGLENLTKTESLKNIFEVYKEEYRNYHNNLEELFGEINANTNSFAKMIGMPIRLLNLFDENKSSIPLISWFKKIYNQEYLWHVDVPTFQNTLDCAIEYIEKYTIYSMPIIEKLINIFGVRNLNNYFMYFSDGNISRINFSKYIDYISMIEDYNLDELGFTWKIKGNQLTEMHDRAVEIINARDSEEMQEMYGDEFEQRKSEWERFSYEDKYLVVIPPNSIYEVLKEGQMLSHCVRTYIDDIVKGKTIILFIRKNDFIDIPYYTLEIRDGKIRQCHGNKNCNPTFEVDKFLKKFCKAKNILYNGNNEILPVN